jgi:hypothetical protein
MNQIIPLLEVFSKNGKLIQNKFLKRGSIHCYVHFGPTYPS